MAGFAAEQGVQADARNDIKLLAKDLVEELETVFLDPYHQVFFRAELETTDRFAAVAASIEGRDNRDNQKTS